MLYLHLVAALYAFTKRWQEESAAAGLLAATLVGFLFLLVWSLSGAFVRALISAPMVTPWLSRDGLGLLLPLPLEIALFVYLFVRQRRKEFSDTPRQ